MLDCFLAFGMGMLVTIIVCLFVFSGLLSELKEDYNELCRKYYYLLSKYKTIKGETNNENNRGK